MEIPGNLREVVRNLPKQMYDEKEDGIYLKMDELLKGKETRSASPVELLGIVTDLWSSTDPKATLVLWVIGLVFGLPIVAGLLMVLFGQHRTRNLLPPVSLYVPLAGTFWFLWDPVGVVLAYAKKFAAGFNVLIAFSEIGVFPGAKGLKTVAGLPKEKASFLHGFKLLFDSSIVSTSMKAFQEDFMKAMLAKPQFIDQIYTFAPQMLRKRLAQIKKKEEVDLFKLSSEISLRILLRLAIGEEAYEQYGDETIPILQLTETNLMAPGFLCLRSWWPFKAAARHSLGKIAIIVTEQVDARSRNRNAQFVDIPYILKEAAPKCSVDLIASHITAFIFANHSDLAGTIAWTIYHIIKDDGLKGRVMAELDQANLLVNSEEPTVFGPVDSDLLRTLTSTIKEVGRRYAPLFLLRGMHKRLEINDFVVYNCDLICASPLTFSMNEKYYPNPNEFDPSRFFDTEKVDQLIKKGRFVQFDNAENAWLGAVVAETIVKAIVIPAILGQFNVSLVDEKFEPRPAYLKTFSTPFSDLPLLVKFKPIPGTIAAEAAGAKTAAKRKNAKKVVDADQ
eukprot:jgi/Hompol1/1062/HPOL_001350-RA